MYTINDTMFALLLRFIGQQQEITFCDDEFMQNQLKTINDYVEKFPSEEQELRAIEWVENYAEKYRKLWEKEVIDKNLFDGRCPDCPLIKEKDSEHCEIHNQWLELLDQFATNKINSKKYVENTLELLALHKEKLRVKLSKLEKKEEE